MKRSCTLVAVTLGVLLVGCRDASFPTEPQPKITGSRPEIHTGWIFGPAGIPVEVKYEIIGGLSIHEGDIDLGPAGTVAKTREELLQENRPEGPRYGVVIEGGDYRWGSGRIPYFISSDFSESQRQMILDAMAHITSRTYGTTFVPRTTEASYVMFWPHSSVCSSKVGREGGSQPIYLASGCFVMGIIAHEILHAFGMWHEQSRCDRDSYVTINWGNIESGKEHNFEKKCASDGWFWSTGGIDLLSYSEGSLMHYGPDYYSNNGQPTITSTRGLDYLMGQRAGLHQSDATTINTIYKPYAVQGLSASYSGGTPLVTWNAANYASNYSVYLAIVYEEYNGYENWSRTWDHEIRPIGSTSGLSLNDTQHAYTGTSECYVWNEWYGYARYVYYYEVRATFPDGTLSAETRWRADVAPEVC